MENCLPYFKFGNIYKNKYLQKTAAKLRTIYNPSLDALWKNLNDSKYLHGFNLERNVVVFDYIIDLFIPELGIVILLNGKDAVQKYEIDPKLLLLLERKSFKTLIVDVNDIKINLSFIYHKVDKTVVNRLLFFLLIDHVQIGYSSFKYYSIPLFIKADLKKHKRKIFINYILKSLISKILNFNFNL